MCGIAGIMDTRRDPDPARMDAMLQVLEHRGPDGSGTSQHPGVVLGHRRLAIIDITDSGAQPMTYGNGRFTVTYNGEVYNYIELRDELRGLGHNVRSKSDTEVLLAAYAEWGRDCLHRLNGMFAFAIYDREHKTLFCARDRLGVKPFVYSWDGATFGFASEPKALIAGGLISTTPSPDAMYEYLCRGYTSEGRSFFKDVTVLQPGCALTMTASGKHAVWEWWQPNRDVDPHPDISDAAFQRHAEKIGSLLDDAVRLRLRSDVPVGAHLSGGLDSSAVAALAAQHSGNSIHTFTGAFAGDRRGDEREYSRAVNSMYGLATHEVEIRIDDLAGEFQRLLWHLDEPIAGPGVFPQLAVCDLARREGVTVVLGGQGGDELFGGYLRHRARYHLNTLKSGNPVERMRSFRELATLSLREGFRVRQTATRVADAQLDPAFLDQVSDSVRHAVRRSMLDAPTAADRMWHDLRSYLPALLHVEDRTSMAASLESRTPLLDFRLVEYSLQIPDALRFRPGYPKPLLREAVLPHVPRTVSQRTDKKGFPTPLQTWQGNPTLSKLVRELTHPQPPLLMPLFTAEYLGQRDNYTASQLWTVMTMQGWMQSLSSGALSDTFQQAA